MQATQTIKKIWQKSLVAERFKLRSEISACESLFSSLYKHGEGLHCIFAELIVILMFKISYVEPLNVFFFLFHCIEVDTEKMDTCNRDQTPQEVSKKCVFG